MSRCMAIFFLSYCIIDLVVGTVEYESQINMNEGWLHHLFFIGLLTCLLLNGQTNLFAVGVIEELPTIILSIKRVRDKTDM